MSDWKTFFIFIIFAVLMYSLCYLLNWLHDEIIYQAQKKKNREAKNE